MSGIRLAVFGYSTDAGKAFNEVLQDSCIEVSEIYPLSYTCSEYDAVTIGGKNCLVLSPDNFNFKNADIVLILGASSDADKVVAKAKAAGARVVDASGRSSFQGKNVLYLAGQDKNSITESEESEVLIPAGSPASMLAFILRPLAEHAGLRRATITLMEAVSGLGEEGASELARETIALLNMSPIEPRLFKSQLAFNMHSAVGDTISDGSTSHENAVLDELSMLIPDVPEGISLTAVVAPVFYGHTASIEFTLDKEFSLAEVREFMGKSPELEFVDEEEITPVEYGRNEDKVFISRLRQDAKKTNTFKLVAVMDNAKRGIAMNCLEIIRAVVPLITD